MILLTFNVDYAGQQGCGVGGSSVVTHQDTGFYVCYVCL